MERVVDNFALGVVTLAVLLAGCTRHGERDQTPVQSESDQTYLERVVFPAITEFSRQHRLDLTNALTTNRLTLCKIHRVTERPAIISSLRIDGRHAFSLLDENGRLTLNIYQRLPGTWSDNYSNISPEKRKVIEQWPNTLTPDAAREMLLRHFNLAGHRETNFHPILFRQIAWREPAIDKNGLAIISGPGAEHGGKILRLPFYEARWFRRDVDMKAHYQGDVMQPVVHIVISGQDRSLSYYSRGFMPLEGGDWGKGPSAPAHPNSTTNSP